MPELRAPPHQLIARSLLLGAGLILACSPDASAAYFHRFENRREAPQVFRLMPEISYLTTTTNYDASGAKATALSGYKRTQLDLDGVYGFNSRLSAFFRLNWLRNQLDSEAVEGSSYGPGDQEIGLNYHVWESANSKQRMSFDLQLQASFPLYDNATARDLGNPLIGDGSTDITLGGFFTAPLNSGNSMRWTALIGAGYMLRTAGFSPAIPWNLTLVMQPQESGIFSKLSILGHQSLITESGTTLITGSSSFDAGDSFIIGPLNSTFMSGRLIAGYQQNSSNSYFFTATKSLMGKSAPDALVLALGLQMRFGVSGKKSAAQQSPRKYGKANKGFVNYSFEAKVMRANDRLNLVKIDKGSQDGVEVGQTFDIFSVNKDGSVHEAVARALVSNIQSNEAALSIKEYFREIWIEEGFIAKRPVQ